MVKEEKAKCSWCRGFNSLLEMLPIFVDFINCGSSSAFQFSIGDAKIFLQPTSSEESSSFNSLLEMPCPNHHAVRQACREALSILYWRCSPYTARLRLRRLKRRFQFSIGDALQHDGGNVSLVRRFNSLLEMQRLDPRRDQQAHCAVSILYWRCQWRAYTARSRSQRLVSILYWRCLVADDRFLLLRAVGFNSLLEMRWKVAGGLLRV